MQENIHLYRIIDILPNIIMGDLTDRQVSMIPTRGGEDQMELKELKLALNFSGDNTVEDDFTDPFCLASLVTLGGGIF